MAAKYLINAAICNVKKKENMLLFPAYPAICLCTFILPRKTRASKRCWSVFSTNISDVSHTISLNKNNQ